MRDTCSSKLRVVYEFVSEASRGRLRAEDWATFSAVPGTGLGPLDVASSYDEATVRCLHIHGDTFGECIDAREPVNGAARVSANFRTCRDLLERATVLEELLLSPGDA